MCLDRSSNSGVAKYFTLFGGALPNGTVSLLNQSWPIARRLDINLPRAALTNNANGYARIAISVDWTGGSAKTAIAVRMV